MLHRAKNLNTRLGRFSGLYTKPRRGPPKTNPVDFSSSEFRCRVLTFNNSDSAEFQSFDLTREFPRDGTFVDFCLHFSKLIVSRSKGKKKSHTSNPTRRLSEIPDDLEQDET